MHGLERSQTVGVGIFGTEVAHCCDRRWVYVSAAFDIVEEEEAEDAKQMWIDDGTCQC